MKFIITNDKQKCSEQVLKPEKLLEERVVELIRKLENIHNRMQGAESFRRAVSRD